MWPSRDAGSGLGTVSHLPPPKHRCFRSVHVAGGCFGESSAFLQHTRVIHKQRAQQWTPDAEPPQWDASKIRMGSQMPGQVPILHLGGTQVRTSPFLSPSQAQTQQVLSTRRCSKWGRGAFICPSVQTSYCKWLPPKFRGVLSVLKSGWDPGWQQLKALEV